MNLKEEYFMWTVKRLGELGLIGQDVFSTEEEAKRGFRKIIANKLGEVELK